MSSLIGVVGKRGSGKTTFLTAQAQEAHHHGVPIASNYTLNGIPTKHLRPPPQVRKDEDEEEYHARLSDHFGELDDHLVLMSEAYRLALDSRRSQDGRAIAWTWWFSESRKRHANVLVDSQSIGKLDMRLRELLDYLVVAKCGRCEGCGATGRWACWCDCAGQVHCPAEWTRLSWFEQGGQRDVWVKAGRDVWFYRRPYYGLFESEEVLNLPRRSVTS